jgi:CarD family transcriptional regulator
MRGNTTFSPGDHVYYGTTGVCTILEFRTVELGGSLPTTCYVLKPIDNRAASPTIYVPAEPGALLANMRPVLTKAEVLALIAEMPALEDIWIGSDRDRNKDYWARIRTCDSRELVKVIRTLFLAKNAGRASRRLTSNDEKLMDTATSLVHGEFALALGIGREDVLPFILKHLPAEPQAAPRRRSC